MNRSADTRPAAANRFAHWRKILVRIAKVIIATAVAVGLYFAADSALTQWRLESDKLRAQIDEIDQAIMQSDQPQRLRELQRSKEKLEATIPSIENLNWGRIGWASLLYALGLIPPAFLLRRALRSLGQNPHLSTAIAAQCLGHVGKYVPGKAMVVVLRVGALARDSVRPLAATISVFLETFLMMAVGAAVAGVIVWWLPVPDWIAIASIGVAVLASLPTLPPILRRVAARVSGAAVSEIDSKIGMRLFVAGWGWSMLGWALIGASFTMLISAIPSGTPLPATPELYATATAAICLAIVIGFASLLPGGAGVRELVMMTVLSVSIGPVHGLLSAIAARIMFMFVDALIAGVAWIWLRSTDDKTEPWLQE